MDQRRRGEGDAEALLAGGQAQAQGDVGLAGAAVAQGDDVFAAQDVRLSACCDCSEQGPTADEHKNERSDSPERRARVMVSRREVRAEMQEA